MPQNVALRPFLVVACSIAILCCSVVARAQEVDPGFDPGANQSVLAMAVQPDGKIIVGGGFTGLGGVTGTTLRNHIGRLNVDGTVDPSFNPGTNSIVQAAAVQPDGKILIGGNFTSVGGGTGLTTSRNYLARFNADGTVDTSFNPGANLTVYAIIVQPDGKILVGGQFSTIGGGGMGSTTRNRLARLNPDGSVDSFDPGVSKPGASAIVYTMALQPDGKVVVGGYFNGLGGGTGATVRNFIGRINADGTLDTGFNPGASSISGVNALAIQADGKIVVGGSFTGLGAGGGAGTTLRGNIGRINPDGSVDLGFNPGTESQVLALGVQVDGRILAGGYFKWMGAAGGVGKSTRNYIGRLNPDGVVDSTFNPGADNILTALAVQPDGAILAAGSFLKVGGGGGVASTTFRNHIARFTATDAAIQTLTVSGSSTVSWARSGAGPEVSRVTFESSANGANYTLLGSGTRVAGGWQLGGLSLSTHQRLYIRARGSYGTGFQNGSGSIVESILNRPPSSRKTESDFDGDGTSDITVFRPSTGQWFVRQSSTLTLVTLVWGGGSDKPVAGDYDGDGITDIAIFRPSTGEWFVRQSSNFTLVTLVWGGGTDIPVPGDYDGDGKTDIAVFRPSSGTWYTLKSSDSTFTAIAWGISTDIPVQADYDGDGKTDVSVFRPSSGTWYIFKSSDFTVNITNWGVATDIPVQADYDGDGKADIAIFRPSTGTWWILESGTLSFTAFVWGGGADIPVPGDYDGDGKADVAVFRASTGEWFVRQSSTSTPVTLVWGGGGDIPILKKP